MADSILIDLGRGFGRLCPSAENLILVQPARAEGAYESAPQVLEVAHYGGLLSLRNALNQAYPPEPIRLERIEGICRTLRQRMDEVHEDLPSILSDEIYAAIERLEEECNP